MKMTLTRNLRHLITTTSFHSSTRTTKPSLATRLSEARARLESKFTLPERFKGTIVEKWAKFWRQLVIDYKEMLVDTVQTIREKPLKSAIYGAIGTTAYMCAKNNPEESDFEEEFRKCQNRMAMVHESLHNPVAAEHIRFIDRCYNEGRVKRLNFGVVSFLWVDDYGGEVGLYKATCEYLRPRWREIPERVIDVGFWNRWWTLERKMRDYDVNFEE